ERNGPLLDGELSTVPDRYEQPDITKTPSRSPVTSGRAPTAGLPVLCMHNPSFHRTCVRTAEEEARCRPAAVLELHVLREATLRSDPIAAELSTEPEPGCLLGVSVVDTVCGVGGAIALRGAPNELSASDVGVELLASHPLLRHAHLGPDTDVRRHPVALGAGWGAVTLGRGVV